jgi:siderophore synthetase component
MKATLSFNLDLIDDEMDHRRCMKSLDMALFIFDFSNKMRRLVDTSEDGKYIDEQHLWNAWNESLEAYDINIDRLVV